MSALDRREFLARGTAGTGALLAANGLQAAEGADAPRPNIVFIVCDQLNLDAIAAHGCRHVNTPNLDRLIREGTTFIESHSTNPVCSPARSSMFTGRMPVETGVITNGRAIHPGVPTMGTWLSRAGYETVYCGKWHLPQGYPEAIEGFRVIPVGKAQGDLVDNTVARLCEGYLTRRTSPQPFLLVASFMQPHDICYWAIHNQELVPDGPLPYAAVAEDLPDLPPNLHARPAAPAKLGAIRGPDFSDLQWQLYRYIYFRQVEMLDADVGRLLRAIDDAGIRDRTVVVFTSDHGEGQGRHSHVQKWYPYEESVKVPLILRGPGRAGEGVRDTTHLVSGIDIFPTFCDWAGVPAPAGVQGRSLRPLLEGRPTPDWRSHLVTEHHIVGRMVRSSRYKYVVYEDDPVEQLFDLVEDPWEMTNLATEDRHRETIEAHRAMLASWRNRMDAAPGVTP